MKHQIAFSKWEWPHFLHHPFIALRDLWVELRWAVQRGLYGYSDVDRHNIGPYLLEWLPIALREMAQNCPSYPPGWTHDDWRKSLSEMADGLDKAHRIVNGWEIKPNDPDYGRFLAAGRQAMHKVADNLYDLWD